MINQAIHILMMENDLLCLMQMRMNDVKVNDSPKIMEETSNDMSHAICGAAQDCEEVCITSVLHGVTSYFLTRKPTTLELVTCRQFDLMAKDPEWDPSLTTFQEQEDAQVDSHGMVHDTGGVRSRRFIFSVQVL
jgi:hypothetical protein